MQQNTDATNYRDDIFNINNLVGFASKQTMYQAHALFFDAPEGAGALITSRHTEFSPGRQVLDRDQLELLKQMEGSNYQEYNQSYQRVIGDMFAKDIEQIKEETIFVDAAIDLLQPESLQSPDTAALANNDDKTEYELGFQSPADDETKPAARTKFNTELDTALKSLFTDYEGEQPRQESNANQPNELPAQTQITEDTLKPETQRKVVSAVPDMDKRSAFAKEESTMAVLSESMHKLDAIGRKKGLAKVPVNEIFDTQDVLGKTPSLSHLTSPLNKAKAKKANEEKRDGSNEQDKKKGKDKKRGFFKKR